MRGLPPAVHQYPSCGACGCDTDHDGDQFACYDCQLSFDNNTLEAEFINPDEEPCGAQCGNHYHRQPDRIKPGLTFECQPCALPVSHHDGDPKDYQHWHDCKAVRIAGVLGEHRPFWHSGKRALVCESCPEWSGRNSDDANQHRADALIAAGVTMPEPPEFDGRCQQPVAARGSRPCVLDIGHDGGCF